MEHDPHRLCGLCGKRFGLPCARNDSLFTGQSQVHQPCHYENIFVKEQKTPETEREGTTNKKRARNIRGNIKARGAGDTPQWSRYSKKDCSLWRTRARAERKSDRKPPVPLVG